MKTRKMIIVIVVLAIVLIACLAICVGMSAVLKNGGNTEVDTPAATVQQETAATEMQQQTQQEPVATQSKTPTEALFSEEDIFGDPPVTIFEPKEEPTEQTEAETEKPKTEKETESKTENETEETDPDVIYTIGENELPPF